MPQATREELSGGLDGFAGEFKTTAVRKELPASAPGELPALSSQLGTAMRTLLVCCFLSDLILVVTCSLGVFSVYGSVLST